MHFGLYGKPTPASDWQSIVGYLERGLVARDHTLRWRNPAPFTPDQVEPGFDAVAVLGFREPKRTIIESYTRAGIPGLVVEMGYLRRWNYIGDKEEFQNSYFQLSLGRLNWIPEVKCPYDRFQRLKLSRKIKQRTGERILLVGQKAGDSQHPFGDNVSVRRWASLCIGRIRELCPEKRIVWRPHPLGEISPLRFSELHNPKEIPLAEDLEDCHAMVTWNSTSGQEALLAGVPVFCHPSAMYAEVANTELSNIAEPEWFDTRDYFSRLAYAQWTLKEMEAGVWLDFMEPLLREENDSPEEKGAVDGVLHESGPREGEEEHPPARSDGLGGPDRRSAPPGDSDPGGPVVSKGGAEPGDRSG